MTQIPRAPLILGLAGVLPFVWGVATLLSPTLFSWVTGTLGGRFVGPFVMLDYGQVILAFMSGVIWGFATRSTGSTAALGYGLSVVPALWAFFMVGSGPTTSAINLIFGFAGVLGLDWLFWRHGIAPEWWLTLRLILTAIVIACLFVPAFLL